MCSNGSVSESISREMWRGLVRERKVQKKQRKETKKRKTRKAVLESVHFHLLASSLTTTVITIIILISFLELLELLGCFFCICSKDTGSPSSYPLNAKTACQEYSGQMYYNCCDWLKIKYNSNQMLS